MTLTAAQRRVIREIFKGRCAYCGSVLPEKGWHADHIKPVVRYYPGGQQPKWRRLKNGKWKRLRTAKAKPAAKVQMLHPEHDCVENIWPACRACNMDKGRKSLEEWRAEIERLPALLRRREAYRNAIRMGLVIQATAKVTFYFETKEGTKCRIRSI